MAPPEEKALQNIHRQLDQCGWAFQDYRQLNISAGAGVAVREFPLVTRAADYMLYVDGRAIGVVDACEQQFYPSSRTDTTDRRHGRGILLAASH